MTVQADGMPAAAAVGLAKVEAIASGTPVAVEVLTIEEADRRLAGPASPPRRSPMTDDEVARWAGGGRR